MTLTAGTQIGPYQILDAIGAGGMGEVYRARDSRLGRDVAIKVSREQFTDHFAREARAVAALNHPNVCTLYDVGPDYLVMELVDGESPKGPLPLNQALAIARQITDALEAAHEKGIIHRDLKPGNIKVRPSGAVKVLDFGLARIEAAKTSGAGTESPANSPTISLAASQAGMIQGTAAYMSPEQARGKTVDKRADIWAFGAVLYELVTGRQAFEGEDVTETLAKVIQAEPPWDKVPRPVVRLLKKCLEKDPQRRLRDIGDAWELLDDRPETAVATRGRSPLAIGAAAAAAVTTLGLAALSIVHFREKPAAPPDLMRFEIPAPDGTVMQKFAVSPDGRKLAFFASAPTGLGSLWIRSLDSVESRRVVETASSPSITWSPDSRFIAFPGGEVLRKLMKVDSSGGSPQTICEIGNLITGASWSSDGVIIFGSYAGGVWRVPASGGNPSPLTIIDSSRRESGHSTPILLPDGRHFVYLRSSTVVENSGIYLGSMDARPEQQERRRLVATSFSPAYAPSPDPNVGYLLFRQGSVLQAQALDLTKLTTVGDPVTVADHLGNVLEFGNFSASGNGLLAYRSGIAQGLIETPQLKWFDRQGKDLGAATAAPLGTIGSVALAPDGTRAAVVRMDLGALGTAAGARMDVWLHEFARNTATRLTSERAFNVNPVWSADGMHIAYVSSDQIANTGKRDGLYQRASNGSGGEELLLEPEGTRMLTDLSRDGHFLLYAQIDDKSKSDLWVLPLTGDRKPIAYARSDFNEAMGQFSPDNQWIAYVSDETGHDEVYVQPFPVTAHGGGKWIVSSGGGTQPRWRRDGRELFYLAANGRTTMAAEVQYAPSFKTGILTPLFDAPASLGQATKLFSNLNWDVTADGKRFLLTTPGNLSNAPKPPPLTLVMNWTALLKR